MAARSDRGHEPWVFYPQDGRWRWWSFRRGWREVERWQAAIARGEGPAEGAAPAPQSSPQALCCHLAAPATGPAGGFDGLPASRGGSEGRDHVLDVAAGGFDGLLAPWRRPTRGRRRGSGRPAREIVVVAPPAGASPAAAASPTDADRLAVSWLHWCCANLAVLVLEPSREALVGSVLWCRPTVLLVGPEQERALAAAVRERSRGRVRRAAALLDRLRVLLVFAENRGDCRDRVARSGETANEAPEPAAPWRSWGVERRLVG